MGCGEIFFCYFANEKSAAFSVTLCIAPAKKKRERANNFPTASLAMSFPACDPPRVHFLSSLLSRSLKN
jgi:hypothetical protein